MKIYQSSLHESGYVAETVELLGQKGWTYEKDGALWLNTTQLLKEKYMREGKTQEQLAARMQVEGIPLNQKAVSRVETGLRVVSDYELMTFARVLRVTMEHLVGQEEG